MAMKSVLSGILPGILGLTLACSGGGGGGGPMGTPVEDIRGQYTITHQGEIVGVGTLACPGLLIITTQEGTSFSGTITIAETQDCQGVQDQGTISGTVSSAGVLTFTITIPFLDALLEIAGCEIVSGGSTFTGTATTTGLSATRTNRLNCEVEPGSFIEVDLVYTISGSKT